MVIHLLKKNLRKQPFEILDGKTPAKACGIEIKGQDKWKTYSERKQKVKRMTRLGFKLALIKVDGKNRWKTIIQNASLYKENYN